MEIPNELLRLVANSPKFAKLAAQYGYKPGEDQIIYLNKALYGLKQSPRTWQIKLHGLLKDHGFEPLASDSAVYVNLKKRTFIITFVDDCLMIGPDKHYISALKAGVGETYVIEDRGPASYFLGVEIVRDRLNRRLFIT